MGYLRFIAIGVIAMMAVPGISLARTTIIENHINVSANSGGNSANGGDGLPAGQAGADGGDGEEGRDGEDGEDGEDGTIIEGSSRSHSSVKTIINGEVVEDSSVSIEDGTYEKSTTHESENATVKTDVSLKANPPQAVKPSEGEAEDEEAITESITLPDGSQPEIAADSETQTGAVLNAETPHASGIGSFFREIAKAVSAFFYGIFES